MVVSKQPPGGVRREAEGAAEGGTETIDVAVTEAETADVGVFRV